MHTRVQNEQPYKPQPPGSERKDFLSILSELDNATKHRLVQPVGGVVPRFGNALIVAPQGTNLTVAPLFPRLEEEATLMIVTTIPEAVIRMDPNDGDLDLTVELPEGIDAYASIPGLTNDLFQRVTGVLSGFQQEFFTESI